MSAPVTPIVARLREYALDWRDRAASKEIVDEAADHIERLEKALVQIEGGAENGKVLFEQRVQERKNRLTWWAVNSLQDYLAACGGIARAALQEESDR